MSQVDLLKKSGVKFDKVRSVDIDELNMTPTQFDRYDAVPNYAIINVSVNPLFSPFKVMEKCQNIVDIIKGGRALTSLQYNSMTAAATFMLNTIAYYYIAMMDSALQHTKLISYNDTVVMRTLVTNKFGINNAQIDNLLNNREEYERQVIAAKAMVKSKLVRIGQPENLLERFIYEYRFDDQTQYTTKIGYAPDLLIHQAGSGSDRVYVEFLDNALTAAFGVALDVLYTHADIKDGNYMSWFDTYNDTPAKWYDVIEKLTTVAYNDNAYHAFRSDYFAVYTNSALFDMRLGKVKSYFSDSDAAALMNSIPMPAFMAHDTTRSANDKYVPVTVYQTTQSLHATTVIDVFNNRPAYIEYHETLDATHDSLRYDNNNGGYDGIELSSSDTTAKTAAVTVRVLNFHKPTVAKGMEIALANASVPANIVIDKTATEFLGIVQLPLFCFSRINFLWSTHFKDGQVSFTTAQDVRNMPFIEMNTKVDLPSIRGSSEMRNISGLWPTYRWFATGTEIYRLDSVQEQFDLYEVTPASIADSQRTLQSAYLDTALVVADKRVENFAQLLDTIKD